MFEHKATVGGIIWLDDDTTFERLNRKINQDYVRMRQAILNNLFDNNPGELDRWTDDGGR